MVIKSIGVLSMGKMFGAVYAAMGLIFGAFVSLISVFGAFAMNQQQGGGAVPSMILGVGSVVFLPIFYGIIGFIGGIIGAAIYNLVAGVVGGVELDLQPR